jgi:hypothetical protein
MPATFGFEGEFTREECYKKVCQLFCVNDQVLFLGWVREGRGNIPSLAQRFRRTLRFHDAALSKAGIRSGHRIVKWLSAARQ